MAGVKGMYVGPMPKWSDVEKQYAGFLLYRHEIAKYGAGVHKRTASFAYRKKPIKSCFQGVLGRARSPA